MERPTSIASAHGLAPAHKRTASSIASLPKLRSPSLPSLYLTNLKLLNFDLLPDWPDLSILSFSANDARTRLRCVEWSLYQLFCIFDAPMTAEKLQPFFPPLDHLQSVNLRAALHRCLAELKKNGILGREAVLRKTMLDDCTGEKFWELCVCFSSVVLRKATLDTRPHGIQPVAQKYAAAANLEKRDKDSLLPLAIAHKVALNNVLETKTRKREHYVRISRIMDSKEDQLLDRVDVIENQKPLITSAQHAEDLQIIERALTTSTIGNSAFTDAIVNGDPVRPDDMFLLESESDFVNNSISSIAPPNHKRHSGLIDNLQHKAKFQRVRFEQWQALLDQLRAQTPNKSVRSSNATRILAYTKHQELGVQEMHDLAPPSPIDKTEPVRAYLSQYDEILTAMREDLRRSQSLRHETKASPNKPILLRNPSITLDTGAGAAHVVPAKVPSRRSMSPIIPFRPGFNRRTSSRSRSYQQSRVVSQREPIPLKAESYSGTKPPKPADGEPARMLSPMIKTPAVDHGVSTKTRSAVRRDSRESMDTPTIDSAIGLGVTFTDSPLDDPLGIDQQGFGSPNHDTLRGADVAPKSSLIERTRLSMASHHGAADVTADMIQQATATDAQAHTADSCDNLTTRTRQSMSAFNVQLPIRTSSSPQRCAPPVARQSISLPKTRSPQGTTSNLFISDPDSSSLQINGPVTALRDITPREMLFSADAEASSVFKSRPKIATSPVLSPQRLDESTEVV